MFAHFLYCINSRKHSTVENIKSAIKLQKILRLLQPFLLKKQFGVVDASKQQVSGQFVDEIFPHLAFFPDDDEHCCPTKQEHVYRNKIDSVSGVYSQID